MQAFIDFLVNNYLWFLVISLILVFALIGYLVDTNEKNIKDKHKSLEKNDEVIEKKEDSVSNSMEMLEDLEK